MVWAYYRLWLRILIRQYNILLPLYFNFWRFHESELWSILFTHHDHDRRPLTVYVIHEQVIIMMMLSFDQIQGKRFHPPCLYFYHAVQDFQRFSIKPFLHQSFWAHYVLCWLTYIFNGQPHYLYGLLKSIFFFDE